DFCSVSLALSLLPAKAAGATDPATTRRERICLVNRVKIASVLSIKFSSIAGRWQCSRSLPLGIAAKLKTVPVLLLQQWTAGANKIVYMLSLGLRRAQLNWRRCHENGCEWKPPGNLPGPGYLQQSAARMFRLGHVEGARVGCHAQLRKLRDGSNGG